MKYIQDSSIFSVEKGKCWKNTSCFTGYGFGYPRKILWYNFEQLREEFPPLYVEHMSYATLTRKYYQRRTKQARLLSIMYVEKGGMYFNCDGRAMLAEAGDCVLLKPHCQNDFLYQPGDGFCSCFEIILNGNFLDTILALYRLDELSCVRIPDARPFFSLFRRLEQLDAVRSRRSISHELAGCAMEAVQLVRHAGMERVIPQQIVRIRDELKARLGEKINMTEFARRYEISLPVLNRRFREAYGFTPYNWLKRLRLRQGAVLLESGMAVKEIAGLVGYENPRSFSAEFRRFYGVSPRQFLQNTFGGGVGKSLSPILPQN